ncbi:MAG: tRNA(Met) cytidine acetyltransferase [Thioalkalivibrio sp.]|nr:MAG: tRNA(Met) cytidine acetyltransferase [Thioalkalivibrio sp.]
MPPIPPKSACTRQLLAVPDSAETRERVSGWITGLAEGSSVAWLGDDVPPGVPAIRPAQAAHWLGREYDALVFEAGADLHPDALAIAAGLVRGGGVLLLLVARAGSGPFAERFRRFLMEPAVRRADPGSALPAPQAVRPEGRLRLSAGQRRVFSTMLALPAHPGPLTFVLTAPRGRGKSTLLGALVRRWRAEGVTEVRVTAYSPASIEPLLRVLDPGSETDARAPQAGVYTAPDPLLTGAIRPGVLIVDEAAALPVHVLMALAGRASRTVFSTTTAGFEGSGRGFRLRFLRALRRRGHPLQELRLREPVRWAAGDPLEDWINRLFLLDAEVPALADGAGGADVVAGRRVHWVCGERLARDETGLAAVVGLLSDAHYRTRPSDLRRWLDDPALSIGLLRGSGQVLVGVVLLLAEPGLEPGLARSVWAGERRPAGRFLPAVLAAHGGFRAAGRTALRIVRIAVHPRLQRRGIGRRMLRAAERHGRRRGFALLGASFGADAELLAFWEAAGYPPLRVGFRREGISGLHSAVVLRPLQPDARTEIALVRATVARDWPVWRAGPLRTLEPDVAGSVLRSLPPPAAPDPAADHEEVRAFACSQRPFEPALPALRRWLHCRPDALNALSPGDRVLLQAAVTESEDWPRLCARAGESGRAGVIRALRRALCVALGDSG